MYTYEAPLSALLRYRYFPTLSPEHPDLSLQPFYQDSSLYEIGITEKLGQKNMHIPGLQNDFTNFLALLILFSRR
jgi:hypothetical protein